MSGEREERVPLIELCGIRKHYGGSGGTPAVEVLHGIDLKIDAGEFVALVGQSGSGKSTLMHILGCLDRPSSGQYRFAGRDIGGMSPDELASLRRSAFGFVFQGYHLIRALDASHNVQVPAVYAGMAPEQRQQRAQALLARLGLGERAGYTPHQLSGGQQQRVSIARALMNGGQVILADEPTGALDSGSGKEVMALLRELADAGHTVILITHDPKVAAQARRVLRIHDGRIVEDTGQGCENKGDETPSAAPTRQEGGTEHGASLRADVREALTGTWRTLWISRFRTLLTLLGIVIGVASVIVLMAVGLGSSERTLANLAAFGSTHRVMIWPDNDPVTGKWGQLSVQDVEVVRTVPNVEAVVPFNPRTGNLVADEHRFTTWVLATGADAYRVFNLKMATGRYLTEKDETELAPVVVLGIRTRERLFPDPAVNPVGRYLQINRMPFQVVGVLQETGDDEEDHTAMVPFATGAQRLWGSPYAGGIQLRVSDLTQVDQTVASIEQVLEQARQTQDFRCTPMRCRCARRTRPAASRG